MIYTGTRTRQLPVNTRMPSGSETRTHSKDIGMSKNVTASCTFVNSSTKQVQAANGTFPAFAVNDVVLVEGTNLNNGLFTVTSLDAVNQSFLGLDPSPKNEGPITATIRTN